MGYYDSVKDNVKGNDGDSSGSGASFDTLKEKAEDTSENEDDSGDGTPIEVLEEGGLSKKRSNAGSAQRSTSTKEQNTQNQDQGNASTAVAEDSDLSSLEQKLDKIIEQNQRMIEVLESFGS